MTKQTTKWLYGMPLVDGLVYRFSTFMLRFLGSFVWRVQITGLESLPKTEPYLLLGNHSCMLDPFWSGIYIPRGMKAMASATVLNVPYLGAWLKMLGCFPKMKYTKDRDSMRQLQSFYDQGYPVLLFPEGNRSWDGRPGPVGAGIGRLIKRMNCKVVFVNLPTASLYQPRWAIYPRWVPIEINYSLPQEYDDRWSADEIWQDVVKRITVTPKISGNRRTFGFRMAHGLPKFLWACPNCFSLGSLNASSKNGNVVECSHCSEHWTLTVENEMLGQQNMTVATAFDRIAEHFGANPCTDSNRLETSNVALQCTNSTILRRNPSTNKMESIAKGTLLLTTTGLEIQSVPEQGTKNEQWRVPHNEITAISVEIANLLQFRIDGVVHRMVTPEQSSLMWAFFLRGWQTPTQS